GRRRPRRAGPRPGPRSGPRGAGRRPGLRRRTWRSSFVRPNRGFGVEPAYAPPVNEGLPSLSQSPPMTARSQALDLLRAVARKDAGTRIAHQFAADPKRVERMGVEAAGLYLDLSKQSWTAEGFEAALDLARA